MAYLLEFLQPFSNAQQAADALEDVFVRVATEAMAFTTPDVINHEASFDALRARLDCRTVALSEWAHPTRCLRISGGEWDRGEVENNLRQIEVTILSLRSAALLRSTTVRVSPTQQSGADAEGELNTFTLRWSHRREEIGGRRT